MTRNDVKTLAWLKSIAKHTHPGSVGLCTDWTCPDFLDVISGVLAANEALRVEAASLTPVVAAEPPVVATKKVKK
jgi:hypothetical protein